MALDLVRAETLHVRGDRGNLVRSQFVCDDLHDRTFGTLIGSLEDNQLLDDIIGVLSRKARKLVMSFSVRAVARRACGHVLFGKAFGEDARETT